jgi:uncharacterized protein
MRPLLIAVALALFLAPAAAHAQGGSVKKAKQLVAIVVPRDAYERTITQVMQQMIAAMRAQGQTIPADGEPKLKAAVLEVLPYDELIVWNAEVYAKHFSDKELDDLIRFYKTPTGKKAAKILPDLMGEVGAKMGQIMPARLPAALKKHGLTP